MSCGFFSSYKMDSNQSCPCFYSTMDDDMTAIFPSGFHTLIVNDDPTFLGLAKRMLSSCHYKVTTSHCATSALSILRERVGEFDVLLSDADMPEMSGYMLLDIVEGELGIPVIFVSDGTKKEAMRKGMLKGACYFLNKPLDLKEVENLWRVVAWRKFSIEDKTKTPVSDNDKGKTPAIKDSSSSNDGAGSKGCLKEEKKKKKKKKTGKDNSLVHKKNRLIWTADLEKKFVDAVNQLGLEAVPSKITKLMGVEGVDRDHVASHLQKYRIRMSKERNEEDEELPYYMNPALSNVQVPDLPRFADEQAGYFQDLSLNPQVLSPQIDPSQFQMHSSVSNYHMPNMIDAEGFNRTEPFLGAPLYRSSAEWNNVQATDNLPITWSNIAGSGDEANGQFGGGIQQQLLDNNEQNQFDFGTFPTGTGGETNDVAFYNSSTMRNTREGDPLLLSDFSAFPYSTWTNGEASYNYNQVQQHTREEHCLPVPDFAQQRNSWMNGETSNYTNPMQNTREVDTFPEAELTAPNANTYPSLDISVLDNVADFEFSFGRLMG